MDTRTFIAEMPPHYDNVVAILQLFFPQYFDPDSPLYVDPEIMTQLIWLAEETRPWCLSEDRQNFAQAMYTAYLVSLRNETSSGQTVTPVSGPITSEKEGDIQISYGTASSTTGSSSRPASDPWDAWNRMWSRCGRGAIMTRYGDPMKSGIALTGELYPQALNVWFPIW